VIILLFNLSTVIETICVTVVYATKNLYQACVDVFFLVHVVWRSQTKRSQPMVKRRPEDGRRKIPALRVVSDWIR